jgi:hypothetical protein
LHRKCIRPLYGVSDVKRKKLVRTDVIFASARGRAAAQHRVSERQREPSTASMPTLRRPSAMPSKMPSIARRHARTPRHVRCHLPASNSSPLSRHFVHSSEYPSCGARDRCIAGELHSSNVGKVARTPHSLRAVSVKSVFVSSQRSLWHGRSRGAPLDGASGANNLVFGGPRWTETMMQPCASAARAPGWRVHSNCRHGSHGATADHHHLESSSASVSSRQMPKLLLPLFLPSLRRGQNHTLRYLAGRD